MAFLFEVLSEWSSYLVKMEMYSQCTYCTLPICDRIYQITLPLPITWIWLFRRKFSLGSFLLKQFCICVSSAGLTRRNVSPRHCLLLFTRQQCSILVRKMQLWPKPARFLSLSQNATLSRDVAKPKVAKTAELA